VVREDVVDRARVNVEVRAEELHAHGGALDVTARTALSPRRVPRRLPRLRCLPEDEVLDVLLLVLVVGDPVAAPRLREVDPGEPAVARERRDPEVDGALRLVRELLLEELRGDLCISECNPWRAGDRRADRGRSMSRKNSSEYFSVNARSGRLAAAAPRIVLSSTSVRFMTCVTRP
jgi:hypothetical protein